MVTAERVGGGVNIGADRFGAETQTNDALLHTARQSQSFHDVTGQSFMTGGPGGNADSLRRQVIDDILTGPARQGDG